VPPLQISIEQGNVVPLIEQFVVERSVDLLVLGSRGRTALGNMIGGTATRILQTLRCDALVVPGAFRVRA
jgi:nucleotide-binding universal stress UspA family protein